MCPHVANDSNSDGTIINPGAKLGRDDSVGDEGDNANDLRFDEEQRLIREQSRRRDDAKDD
ncbi:hypothetical protein [Specibacter cremeus]|uniref:hypothetical protein n=1 Tax=Specibacter cremeus TaxID=1629051 RepID=UPI000F790B7E|nr:hypothetical protein [Specibacter cremeus]